jgi:hypothetical protein
VLSRACCNIHGTLTVYEAGQVPIIRIGVDLEGEFG